MLSSVILPSFLALWLATGLCIFLYAAELRFPRGAQPSKRARVNAAIFNLITVPMFASTGAVFALLPHVTPLVRTSLIGTIPAIILGPLTFDFVYYWYHRAQHKFAFLWRFHAVHHSIEEMGVPSGYQHVSEPVLRGLLAALPAAWLVESAGSGIVALLVTLQGYYLHSTTKIHFGKFAWVFTDNRCHRIHHSVQDHHRDHNFGVVTMLWDKLFGTAYFPNDEWPDVGLVEQREPRTVSEFLWQPFRRTYPLISMANQQPGILRSTELSVSTVRYNSK